MTLRTSEPEAVLAAETADGAALEGWVQGSGTRALLLVSGLGGGGAFWRPAAASLGRHLRVLRFDQRGIGRSSRGTAECSIRTLAEDCLAMLDAAGIERCVVLGHSTGGCIAQTLAGLAPDRLDGVILSATWLKSGPYMRALFAARQEQLSLSATVYAVNSVFLSYPPDWLQTNLHVVEAACASAPLSPEAKRIVEERISALLAFDGDAQAAKIDMPSLILSARDDLVIPSFMQKELSQKFSGSQIVYFNNGGHFFPISRHEKFCRNVLAWIRQL